MRDKIDDSNGRSHDHQTILAAAAMFSGEFSLDWIIDSTFQKASHVLMAMEQGVTEGWLKKGSTPDMYSFRDSRVQKRTLNQIDMKERERLHQRIVAILKIVAMDDSEKIVTLTHHLLNISNDEDGCRWLLKAADFYRKNFQVEKSLQCLKKCMEDIGSSHGEDADQLFVEAAIAYSKLSSAKQSTTKVLSLLQDAINRAAKWDNKAHLTLIEMQQARYKWLQAKYSGALGHIESVTSMVKDLDDPKLSRSTISFIISFLHWQGHFREAIRNYEKFVKDGKGAVYSGFSLTLSSIVATCYARLGDVNQGLGMHENIRKYCIERGDHYQASLAQNGMGSTMLDIGRIDDALHNFKTAVEVATRENNEFVVIMGKLFLAHAYYLKGDKKQALDHLREYLKLSKQVNMTSRLVPNLLDLCWEMQQGKLPKIPGLSLAKEINLTLRGENIFLKGVAHRYRALLQRQKGLDAESILESLQLSVKWLEESGHQIELAKSRLEIARQYLISGDEKKAKEIGLQASRVLNVINKNLIPDDLRRLIGKPPPGRDLLQNILTMSKEVASIRDPKDLVQYILSTSMRITGAERGAIFLFEDPRPPSLRSNLIASRNLTSVEINDPDFDSSRKIINEVAGKGEGLIVRSDPDATTPASGLVRSQICVPMIIRNKIVGVLYHDNRFLHSAFKDTDIELVSYFASQAAIALDNAKSYEELNRFNAQLQEEKRYYEEMELQTSQFKEIVGESAGIKKILTEVKQVADKDATVLILGETGVGKELIARAIHRNSSRHNKPFICVNCSALSENLITSELFGHEKGSFSGAVRKRTGRFELANGGTLFLDEIGDLPQEVQVRLLRVLQTNEFERVGGEETLRSDFRLLCATNRNLKQEVKKNKFREDLYYRLNVFPIYVPPLRERRKDIPLLAHHFVKLYSTRMRTAFEAIPKSEIDKLMEYDWPGNVREFENVIERSVILSPGPYFRAVNLAEVPPDFPLEQSAISLEENERRHIVGILQKTGWKVRGPGGAAEVLEINPSTLRSRIKKLGIQRPQFNAQH